ncbi:MAG: hypothetical protein K2M56_02025, partial [Muribaculaceae bacterium]|nr:hypothetical protein [Muribaculaceae bacterium]
KMNFFENYLIMIGIFGVAPVRRFTELSFWGMRMGGYLGLAFRASIMSGLRRISLIYLLSD